MITLLLFPGYSFTGADNFVILLALLSWFRLPRSAPFRAGAARFLRMDHALSLMTDATEKVLTLAIAS